MPDEQKPGFLENLKQRVVARADGLRADALATVKDKAAEIRGAFGPERMEPVALPERPFGREEGGLDVSRVIWTSHTVLTPSGQSYFAAAGLTENGYYRAAEVQVYGSDETWRWQPERHIDREHAIASAQGISADRLRGGDAPALDGAQAAWREVFGKEQMNMAELPEHVKTKAEAATANLNQADIKMADAGPPVNERADPYDGKAMELQRDQQRQNALDRKGPETTPEPDR